MRAVLAVAAVMAAVLALVGCGANSSASLPGNASLPASTDSPKASGIAAARVVLECEEYKTLDDKGPDGSVVIKAGQQFEGKQIKFLDIPDGWIKKCGVDALKSQPDKMSGFATYEFEVPRDGTYFVNIRAKWLDSCGNSIWLKIDEQPYFFIEDELGKINDTNFKWAWHPFVASGKKKGFELKAGVHKFEVRTREDGPKLDQVLLTTESSTPVGDAVSK